MRSFVTETKGQSLVEVLIAIAIGVFVILVAAAIIGPTIRRSGELRKVQVANGIARELLENVRTFAESNWHNLDSLIPGTWYYLSSSTGVLSGTETLVISTNNTTTYSRYFYIQDVLRDAGGTIGPSGTNDSSTKQVVVVYGWLNGPTSTLSQYISRYKNRSFTQTDWSGGVNPGIVTITSTIYFVTSSNINYVSSTGSVIIDSF